jgi:hypothetical protein
MEVSGQPHAPVAAIWWQLLLCLPDIWYTDNSVALYVCIPVRLQGVTVTLCHCVLDISSSRGGRGCSQYPPEYKVAEPWRRLRARSATKREMASLKSLWEEEHRNNAGVLNLQNNSHIHSATHDTVPVYTVRAIRKLGLPCSDFHKKKSHVLDSITWRFLTPNLAKIGK